MRAACMEWRATEQATSSATRANRWSTALWAPASGLLTAPATHRGLMPNGGNGGGFNSAHAGGVHGVAGDGAVHFISDKINPLVYCALGTSKRFTHSTFNYNHATDTSWSWTFAGGPAGGIQQ